MAGASAAHADHASSAARIIGSTTERGPKARRKALTAMAASSSAPSRSAAAVRAISSVSVVSDTVRSSVERVTLTPARCSFASGWAASSRHDAGLHVAGGTEVQGHVTLANERQHVWILAGRDAVGDAPNVEGECLADPLRPRHLAGMRGQRQAAGRRLQERGRVWRGWILRLRTRQIEPDHRGSEGRRRLRQLDVGPRRVGAHGGHDQPDERRARAEPGGSLGDAAGDRLDHGGNRHPFLEVQPRRPSDLRVRDAVIGQRLDQLGGDAAE